MMPNEEIQDLTDQLGLINHSQDWGIANADARRVVEFIHVCRVQKLSLSQQYAVAELVLASMNEALVEGLDDGDLLAKFDDFLMLELHELPDQIRYWGSLTDDAEEFPVANLLGKVLSTP